MADLRMEFQNLPEYDEWRKTLENLAGQKNVDAAISQLETLLDKQAEGALYQVNKYGEQISKETQAILAEYNSLRNLIEITPAQKANFERLIQKKQKADDKLRSQLQKQKQTEKVKAKLESLETVEKRNQAWLRELDAKVKSTTTGPQGITVKDRANTYTAELERQHSITNQKIKEYVDRVMDSIYQDFVASSGQLQDININNYRLLAQEKEVNDYIKNNTQTMIGRITKESGLTAAYNKPIYTGAVGTSMITNAEQSLSQLMDTADMAFKKKQEKLYGLYDPNAQQGYDKRMRVFTNWLSIKNKTGFISHKDPKKDERKIALQNFREQSNKDITELENIINNRKSVVNPTSEWTAQTAELEAIKLDLIRKQQKIERAINSVITTPKGKPSSGATPQQTYELKLIQAFQAYENLAGEILRGRASYVDKSSVVKMQNKIYKTLGKPDVTKFNISKNSDPITLGKGVVKLANYGKINDVLNDIIDTNTIRNLQQSIEVSRRNWDNTKNLYADIESTSANEDSLMASIGFAYYDNGTAKALHYLFDYGNERDTINAWLGLLNMVDPKDSSKYHSSATNTRELLQLKKEGQITYNEVKDFVYDKLIKPNGEINGTRLINSKGILNYLENAVAAGGEIAGHNFASFDAPRILASIEKANGLDDADFAKLKRILSNNVRDTLDVSRSLWDVRFEGGNKLQSLREWLLNPATEQAIVQQGGKHTAASDALANLFVDKEMMSTNALQEIWNAAARLVPDTHSLAFAEALKRVANEYSMLRKADFNNQAYVIGSGKPNNKIAEEKQRVVAASTAIQNVTRQFFESIPDQLKGAVTGEFTKNHLREIGYTTPESVMAGQTILNSVEQIARIAQELNFGMGWDVIDNNGRYSVKFSLFNQEQYNPDTYRFANPEDLISFELDLQDSNYRVGRKQAILGFENIGHNFGFTDITAQGASSVVNVLKSEYGKKAVKNREFKELSKFLTKVARNSNDAPLGADISEVYKNDYTGSSLQENAMMANMGSLSGAARQFYWQFKDKIMQFRKNRYGRAELIDERNLTKNQLVEWMNFFIPFMNGELDYLENSPENSLRHLIYTSSDFAYYRKGLAKLRDAGVVFSGDIVTPGAAQAGRYGFGIGAGGINPLNLLFGTLADEAMKKVTKTNVTTKSKQELLDTGLWRESALGIRNKGQWIKDPQLLARGLEVPIEAMDKAILSLWEELGIKSPAPGLTADTLIGSSDLFESMQYFIPERKSPGFDFNELNTSFLSRIPAEIRRQMANAEVGTVWTLDEIPDKDISLDKSGTFMIKSFQDKITAIEKTTEGFKATISKIADVMEGTKLYSGTRYRKSAGTVGGYFDDFLSNNGKLVSGVKSRVRDILQSEYGWNTHALKELDKASFFVADTSEDNLNIRKNVPHIMGVLNTLLTDAVESNNKGAQGVLDSLKTVNGVFDKILQVENNILIPNFRMGYHSKQLEDMNGNIISLTAEDYQYLNSAMLEEVATTLFGPIKGKAKLHSISTSLGTGREYPYFGAFGVGVPNKALYRDVGASGVRASERYRRHSGHILEDYFDALNKQGNNADVIAAYQKRIRSNWVTDTHRKKVADELIQAINSQISVEGKGENYTFKNPSQQIRFVLGNGQGYRKDGITPLNRNELDLNDPTLLYSLPYDKALTSNSEEVKNFIEERALALAAQLGYDNPEFALDTSDVAELAKVLPKMIGMTIIKGRTNKAGSYSASMNAGINTSFLRSVMQYDGDALKLQQAKTRWHQNLRELTGDSQSELFRDASSQIMAQSARLQNVAPNMKWEAKYGNNVVGISPEAFRDLKTASQGATNEDIASAIRTLLYDIMAETGQAYQSTNVKYHGTDIDEIMKMGRQTMFAYQAELINHLIDLFIQNGSSFELELERDPILQKAGITFARAMIASDLKGQGYVIRNSRINEIKEDADEDGDKIGVNLRVKARNDRNYTYQDYLNDRAIAIGETVIGDNINAMIDQLEQEAQQAKPKKSKAAIAAENKAQLENIGAFKTNLGAELQSTFLARVTGAEIGLGSHINTTTQKLLDEMLQTSLLTSNTEAERIQNAQDKALVDLSNAFVNSAVEQSLISAKKIVEDYMKGVKVDMDKLQAVRNAVQNNDIFALVDTFGFSKDLADKKVRAQLAYISQTNPEGFQWLKNQKFFENGAMTLEGAKEATVIRQAYAKRGKLSPTVQAHLAETLRPANEKVEVQVGEQTSALTESAKAADQDAISYNKAAQAELAKADAAKQVSSAVAGETKAFQGETGALNVANSKFKEHANLLKELGVSTWEELQAASEAYTDSVKTWTPEYDKTNHLYYTDQARQHKVMSITQLDSILKGGYTNDDFDFIKNKYENLKKGQKLTDVLPEKYDFERVAGAYKGNYIHALVDALAKSGLKLSDMLDANGQLKSNIITDITKGRGAFSGNDFKDIRADLKENKSILNSMGLDDKYINASDSLTGMIKVMQDWGMEFTNLSEEMQGVSIEGIVNGTRVLLELAGRMDQIVMLASGKFGYFDSKTYESLDPHSVQAAFHAIGLVHNPEFKERLKTMLNAEGRTAEANSVDAMSLGDVLTYVNEMSQRGVKISETYFSSNPIQDLFNLGLWGMSYGELPRDEHGKRMRVGVKTGANYSYQTPEQIARYGDIGINYYDRLNFDDVLTAFREMEGLRRKVNKEKAKFQEFIDAGKTPENQQALTEAEQNYRAAATEYERTKEKAGLPKSKKKWEQWQRDEMAAEIAAQNEIGKAQVKDLSARVKNINRKTYTKDWEDFEKAYLEYRKADLDVEEIDRAVQNGEKTQEEEDLLIEKARQKRVKLNQAAAKLKLRENRRNKTNVPQYKNISTEEQARLDVINDTIDLESSASKAERARKEQEKAEALEKKQSAQAVKDILRNESQQDRLNEDIRRLEITSQTQAGDAITLNDKAIAAKREQIRLLQQEVLELEKSVTLSDDKKKLEEGRTKNMLAHKASMAQIEGRAKESVGFLDRLLGGFKQQITWFIDRSLAYSAIGKIRQIINNFITTTAALDKALVNIQIATGNTRKETTQLLKEYQALAIELGRTTQEVAAASNDWLRAGYQGKEAAELTRASMMLSTLGMIESGEATKYLISTLKGWKLSASEVISVVDKLTAVDMSAAISAGDLALAMSRANNSARLAGADMDKFIGYVTTVADVSQKSAESVGESFKTIFSRFGNVKAGKFVASADEQNAEGYSEDNFSNLNDIEMVLSRVGIKVRENYNTWRDIDDVLSDIGEKWSTWDKTTQNAVATAIAGVRQRENVVTLFENWDDVAKYAEIAENAYGTASEKMKAYTDSVEASKQRLTAAVEGWVLWLDGAGAMKVFYNTLTNLIDNLNYVIAAVVGWAALFKTTSLINTFSNAATKTGVRMINLGLAGQAAQEGRQTLGQRWANNTANRNKIFRETYYQDVMKMYNDKLSVYTQNLDAGSQALVQSTNAQLNSLQVIDKQTGIIDNSLTAQQQVMMANITDAAIKGTSANVTASSIEFETARAMATSLLGMSETELAKILKQDEINELKKIASSDTLDDAQKQLALQYYSQVMQAKGKNKKTRNAMGVLTNWWQDEEERQSKGDALAKQARMAGMGSMIGGSAGAITGGYVFGKFGGAGQTLGTMFGGIVGSAGVSSFLGALNDPEVANHNKTIFQSMGKLGGVSFGLSLGIAVVAAIEAVYDRAMKRLEQRFKEAVDKFNSAQGATAVVSKYDELAVGVDNLGRNISLTDDEYAQFLQYSNQLAELFPELIVDIDAAGNKFIGMGNAVGTVSSKIDELTNSYQKAADNALFDKNWLGKNQFGVNQKEVTKSIKDAQKNLKDARSYIGELNRNSIPDSSDGILWNKIVKEANNRGIDYRTKSIRTYHAAEEQWSTATGFDFDAMSEYNREALQQLIQDTITEYHKSIQEYESEIESLNASMIDEYKAYVRYLANHGNATLADMMNNLTSEQSVLLTSALKKVNQGAEDMGDEAILTRIEDTSEMLAKTFELLNNEKYEVTGTLYMDIATDSASSYKSLAEMQDARNALLDKLFNNNSWMMDKDGNIQTELVIHTLVGYNFEYQDLNENGEIEQNEIFDLSDPSNQIRKALGLDYSSTLPWDLNKYNSTQLNNIFEAVNKGYITTNTSPEVVRNLANMGNSTAKTFEEAILHWSHFTGKVSNQESEDSYYQQLEKFYNDIANGNLDVWTENGKIDDTKLKAELAKTFSDADLTTLDGFATIGKTIKKGAKDIQEQVDRSMSTLNLQSINEYTKAAALSAAQVFQGLDLSEGVDGIIDTYSEMKAAVDSMIATYDKLRVCREEMNAQGHVTWQTMLDLISVNAQYAQVIDWENSSLGEIAIKRDAELTIMQIQAESYRMNMQAAIAEAEQQKESIRLKATELRATGQATDITNKAAQKDLEAAKAKAKLAYETQKATYELNAYNAAQAGDIQAMEQWQAAANGLTPPDLSEIEAGVDTKSIKEEIKASLDAWEKEAGLEWTEGYWDEDLNKYVGAEYIFNYKGNLDTQIQTYKQFINMLDEWEKTGYSKSFYEKNLKSLGNLTSVLDRLKAIVASLNKEYAQWESMLNGRGPNIDINYYQELEKDLKDQLNETLHLMANAGFGTKEYYDYLKEARDLQVQINNLDDERIQDYIDIQSLAGDTFDKQVQLLHAKISTKDSTYEELQYTKDYNDALRDSIKLMQQLAEFNKKIADYDLQYTKGNTRSNAYKQAIGQAEEAINQSIIQAKKLVDTVYQQDVEMLKALGYTAADAARMAFQQSDYQDALSSYLEAQQALGNLYMEDFNNRIAMVENRIKRLETSKPNEWASTWNATNNKVVNNAINKIQEYYDNLYTSYQAIAQDVSKSIANLAGKVTDDQIQEMVDKYNEAQKNMRDTQVKRYEDIKTYQEAVYSALTNEVNRYKSQLEKQKDIITDMYDTELKKLNDKNTSIERTNKLIELQNNLLNAQKEKTRVFRAGIGWTYESDRNKIKSVQNALDEFYRQDTVEDLNNAKEAELKALDDRIKNWDNYLEMLQTRYDEYNTKQEQLLLQERLFANSAEEVEQIIMSDMLNFTEYMSEHTDSFFENQITAFGNFNTSFGEFLNEYKANLENLEYYNRMTVETIAASTYNLRNDDYLNKAGYGGNSSQAYKTTANLYDIVQNDAKIASGNLDALKEAKVVDWNGYVDYSKVGENALRSGNIQQAVYDLVLREAKIKSSDSKELAEAINNQTIKSNHELIEQWKSDGIAEVSAINNLMTAYNNAQAVADAIASQNLDITSTTAQYFISFASSLPNTLTEQQAQDIASRVEQGELLSGNITSLGVSFDSSLGNGTTTLDKTLTAGLSANGDIVSILGAKIDANTAAKQAAQSVVYGSSSSSGGGGSSSSGEGYTIGSSTGLAIANDLGNSPVAKTVTTSDGATWSTDGKGNLSITVADKYGGVTYSGSDIHYKYSNGIENGPVTYTGLAMLHGTPSAPEYVLNTEQAYMLLRNLATKPAEFSSMTSSLMAGDSWTLNGDVILENCDDPAEFWNAVAQSMSNRFNVTKNRNTLKK